MTQSRSLPNHPQSAPLARAAHRAVEQLEARRLLSGNSSEVSALLARLDEGHNHGGGCCCGGCGAVNHYDMPLMAEVPPIVQRAIADMRPGGAMIDKSGAELYWDPAPEAFVNVGEPTPAEGGDGGDITPKAGGSIAQVPALSSNPSSPKKLFLDFDGHIVTGTNWNNAYNNGQPIHALPYSLDSDPFSFTQTELSNIQQIWRRVAEDFAPFNVDVTTVDPGLQAFTAGATALRVMISTDVDAASMGGTGTRWFSGAGGVAYLGSWRWTSDTPVWAFYNNLGSGNPKYVAEAVSHEIGHAYDLRHDGVIGGSAYYSGHGSGPTGWAPLMGVGYNRQLSQWSKGEYNNANNQEDDLAIITRSANQVTFRADDHGNTTSTASSVGFNDSNNNGIHLRQFESGGIIETRTDVDMHRLDLTAGNGRLTLLVAPWFHLAGYNNLDVKATLYRQNGSVVEVVNPASDVDAFFDLELTAGTYFLGVEGTGKGDPLGTGYTDYASLGQYDVVADYQYTPSANSFQEVGGRVTMEAEAFTGAAAGTGNASGHTWTPFNDSVASGNAGIVASPNSGVSTGENLNGPRRDYSINFTNTGTYYVWVRLNGANGVDDSVHVGLNGQAVSLGRSGVTTGNHGQWVWVNQGGAAARLTINVTTPGVHTFNLWMREDGTKIDVFELSNDPNFNPGGTGANEFVEQNGRVDIEAEKFTGQAPGTGAAANHTWSIVNSAGANGGQYIASTPNSGFSARDTLVGPRRDYAIRFNNTGTYYVWVRLWGTNGDDDSVHVGMNGNPLSFGGVGVTTANHGQWVWIDSVSAVGRLKVNVSNPGLQTLNLWMREDGTRIDSFILNRDANFNPGGGGGGGGGGGSGTVTFENLAVGNQGTGTYADPAGFTFMNQDGGNPFGSPENLIVHGTGQGFASKVLHPANWGRKIVVQKTGGGAFSLTSFDYAAGIYSDAGDATVTGFLSGGGTVTASYSFNSKAHKTLNLSWTNLSKVEINFAGGINGAYGALDNFVFPSSAAGEGVFDDVYVMETGTGLAGGPGLPGTSLFGPSSRDTASDLFSEQEILS